MEWTAGGEHFLVLMKHLFKKRYVHTVICSLLHLSIDRLWAVRSLGHFDLCIQRLLLLSTVLRWDRGWFWSPLGEVDLSIMDVFFFCCSGWFLNSWLSWNLWKMHETRNVVKKLSLHLLPLVQLILSHWAPADLTITEICFHWTQQWKISCVPKRSWEIIWMMSCI